MRSGRYCTISLITLVSLLVPAFFAWNAPVRAAGHAASPLRQDDLTPFASRLILAVVERDYAALQELMQDPFTIGFRQSEGITLTPPQAAADLETTYMGPAQAIAFTADITPEELPGGLNPLSLWGPEVDAVKALYVTGLQADGQGEAFLVIARDPAGELYWHGMLVAPRGFAGPAPSPTLTVPPTGPPTMEPSPSLILPAYLLALRTNFVHAGPDATSARVGYLPRGRTAAILGQSDAWWQIECPAGATGAATCWVADDPAAVLATADPAATVTPTPRPNATPTTPAPDQLQPTRIRFAPGAVSATVTGVVQPSTVDQYLLRAAAGQRMTVRLLTTPGRASFAIQGLLDGQPYKRMVDESLVWSATLPRSQDYMITVVGVNEPAAYTLEIQIDPLVETPTPTPAPPVAPVRVIFPPGSTGTSISGNLLSSSPDAYVLRALAGQRMTVAVYSPGSRANFSIQGEEDGRPYKRVVDESRVWSDVLSRTQNYLVTIYGPGNLLPYRLEITVVGEAAWTPTPGPSPPQRISFQPGATSATVAGRTDGSRPRSYLLRALAGQTMFVELAGNAVLGVRGQDDGRVYLPTAIGAQEWSGVLPRSQDYLLTVQGRDRAANFSLTVVVFTTDPTSMEERIRFAPGAISATRSDLLPANGVQSYLLDARRGQRMTVAVQADGPATLGISGVRDGQPLKSPAVGGLFWSGILPADQDYRIRIGSRGEPVDYTLTVTVE